MKVGQLIKVHLPGEALWAEVIEIRHGKVHAKLRNESIHKQFSFGDLVILGPDNYEIVHPAHKIEGVKTAIEEWRRTA